VNFIVGLLLVGTGPPCPQQASLPLGLVVIARLIEGDEHGLRFDGAVVPCGLDARRQDA
jgi:hypothetical protein